MKQQSLYGARLTGTGSAFPKKAVTNTELVARLRDIGVETSHDWIVERTGILERRLMDSQNEEESNSGLAFQAARDALKMAGKTAADLDLILFATVTPDQPLPSNACLLQKKLGAKNAFAMDITAACSGFTYALSTAQQFIQSGKCRCALVIGADTLSAITNWADRGSCVLFGDGAGAVVVEQCEVSESRRILDFYLRADGELSDLIEIPQGGSRHPVDAEILQAGANKVRMKGREVFKEAVKKFVECTDRVLAQTGLTRADVDWFIPHQANLRIIEAVGKRLDFPSQKVLVNIEHFANTSSGTVPTVLDAAVRDGRIKPGDTILTAVFGAGLTYGSMLLRW